MASLATPGFAQTGGLAAQSARINVLRSAGEYSEALPLAQAMVVSLEKTSNNRDLAAALNNLAQIYADQGHDDRAEPIYRRAIALMEKATGLDSFEIAPVLNNLAALDQRQGRFADAEPCIAARSPSASVRLGRIIRMLRHPPAVSLISSLCPGELRTHCRSRKKRLRTIARSCAGCCQSCLRRAFHRGLDVGKTRDGSHKSGLFDLALANELYLTLLGPVEALTRDKRSLLMVPSGALTALPFHLLVTETPQAAIPEMFEGYRSAAWLLRRQAVSVLPSVVSLKSLRAFARKDQGIKPMTGFGDPVFNPAEGGPADRRAASGRVAARNIATSAYTDF